MILVYHLGEMLTLTVTWMTIASFSVMRYLAICHEIYFRRVLIKTAIAINWLLPSVALATLFATGDKSTI